MLEHKNLIFDRFATNEKKPDFQIIVVGRIDFAFSIARRPVPSTIGRLPKRKRNIGVFVLLSTCYQKVL